MGLLVPFFGAFVALAAVPVVIHLWGRPRATRRRFAAMAFLLQSERNTAARRRLREILLMVARAVAIAAVPLILAKPYLEMSSDLPAGLGGVESAVLVLDDSRSMGYVHDGATLFQAAQTQALRLLDGLGQGSQVGALLVSQAGGPGATAPAPPFGELTTDRGRLRRAILDARPTHLAGDTTAALRRAAALLAGAVHGRRRVYLVSDMAAHGFAADPPWGAEGPSLGTLDVTEGEALPNRAVVDLRVEPAPGLRGSRVEAVLANLGDEALKELPITLRVNGKAVAKGLVDLPPHGRVTRSFFHAFQDEAPARDPGREPAGRDERRERELGNRGEEVAPPRVHEAAVELAGDDLPDDDRRFLRVEQRRRVKVLLIDGDPRTVRREDEVFYLETALRPGDRGDAQLQVRVMTLEDLPPDRARTQQQFDDFDVIFLANTKAPDGERGAALESFVARGGGLFLSVGENVDPDLWNTALGSLLPQPLASYKTVGATLQARDDGEAPIAGPGERIARFDRRHPVLAPFEGGADGAAAAAGLAGGAGQRGPAQALREARVARYLLLKPTPQAREEGSGALLHLEDGAPLLVERRHGAGRVMLLTTTVDRDWSDLAIQPAYLPLVQQAARYLARTPLTPPDPPLPVGSAHDIPLADGDSRLEITLPSGAVRWFGEDRLEGRKTLRFSDTGDPGIYRVAAAGRDGVLRPRPGATFAVNVDPGESDLTPLPPAKLAALGRHSGGAAGTELPRRRVELWHALGAVLLGLLLFEGVLTLRR